MFFAWPLLALSYWRCVGSVYSTYLFSSQGVTRQVFIPPRQHCNETGVEEAHYSKDRLQTGLLQASASQTKIPRKRPPLHCHPPLVPPAVSQNKTPAIRLALACSADDSRRDHTMRATSTLTLLALAAQVDCDCECGYTVNASESENFGRFTEVVETDFLHVAHFQSGWIAQAYNVSPENSRGPYGKAAQVENVRSNIIASPYDWSGPGVRGPHPGLQLWNRASLLDIFGTNGSMIPMAEVVSARTDILYGSFRVGMMTTQISVSPKMTDFDLLEYHPY